jgi:hypothetical protein
MKLELLWTNPTPNANYGGRTISIDLSKYRYCVIDAKHDAGKSTDFYSASGSDAMISPVLSGTTYDRYLAIGDVRREVLVIGTTAVTFGDGESNKYEQTNNIWCMPLHIYGIK